MPNPSQISLGSMKSEVLLYESWKSGEVGISLEKIFAFSLLLLSQFWPANQIYSHEGSKEYEMIN